MTESISLAPKNQEAGSREIGGVSSPPHSQPTWGNEEIMTTRPNKTNPTGITNYKIPAGLAALPEWQDLAQAMNRCALAADGTGVTQSEWIDAVQNLASGVAFMDCCSTCERRNDTGELVDTSAAPATTEIEGRWMRGTYICRHGHVWRCGYSVTSPVDLR